jgi:hypothetical protein
VKAIKYGSPDSLELKDIDKPVVGDDEVLVRVSRSWPRPSGSRSLGTVERQARR